MRAVNSLVLVVLAIAASHVGLSGQTPGQLRRVVSAQVEGLDIVHVQGNVWLIAGAGGNIAVQVGPQGLVVVDTGNGRKNDAVLAALKALSDEPVRYVINTSIDSEHTGGNLVLAEAGQPLPMRELAGRQRAQMLAHEKVLLRMSAPTGERPKLPEGYWPNATFYTPEKHLFINDEAIHLVHQPAHSDGDIVAFFRRSDVIVTGEIFRMDRYPRIDPSIGGSFSGILAAVNNLLDLTIPGEKVQGGTMLIPGHGRIGDEFELTDYRNMLVIVRDRIQHMIKQGSSLDQVKATRPTLQYDARWGATEGDWTTDMFIEAIYRELSGHK